MTKLEAQSCLCPICGHQFEVIAKPKTPLQTLVLECLACFEGEQSEKENRRSSRVSPKTIIKKTTS